MIFEQLFEPKSSTYTYVIASGVGREALIIDPVYEEVDRYIRLFARLKLRLVKAIDTHVHADHITGLGMLRDLTRCVTVMGEHSGAEVVSIRVRENDKIDIDGISLRALYTPGHTDDSYSYVMADRVFTGDALLIGGTGRTDFQNGDPLQGYDSLFNKLLKLPDDTLLYPAHDYKGNTVSTIDTERLTNPRLQVKSAQEYADIMNNLKLPNPKMMDVAVPANRNLGRDLQKYVKPGESLSAEQAASRKDQLTFVDLREEAERQRDGWIPGSLHVPYATLSSALEPSGTLREKLTNDASNTVFYCAFGERSAMAIDMARQAGVPGASHLNGGIAAWIRAGIDISR